MKNRDEIKSIVNHIKSRYPKLGNAYWFGSSTSDFEKANDIDLFLKLEDFNPEELEELIHEFESENIHFTPTWERLEDDPKPPPPPPTPMYQNPIIRPKRSKKSLFAKPIHVTYITKGEIERTELFMANQPSMKKVA